MASTNLHLIDGDGGISTANAISHYFATSVDATHASDAPAATTQQALAAVGCNYRVVGVFGGQSSGKSTLLNQLFGTGFQVMNDEEGRSQTTKGCFLGKSAHQPRDGKDTLFVMDFEGTDGIERGEDQNLEKQLSLFALSVADTLIINMWAVEVGRFNAANLSLLRTVFEVNLQLLAHEDRRPCDAAKPTLLFVLRDHTAGSLDKSAATVRKSLAKVWEAVTKPEQFADSDIEQHFTMRFAALPHFMLQRPEFDAAVEDLRELFTGAAVAKEESVFSDTDGTFRQIPLDGLSRYLSSCWSSIKTNKDLDIPSQRQMLARLRCGELAEELIQAFQQDVARRQARLKEGTMTPKLSAVLEEMVAAAVASFDKDTALYADDVVRQQRVELEQLLREAADGLVTAQSERISEGMVRHSDAAIQGVLDKCLRSLLPRVAKDWYEAVAAAARQEEKAGDDSTKAAEKALKRHPSSGAVKKFWVALSQEVEAVSEEVRSGLDKENAGGMAEYLAGDAKVAARTVELLEAAIERRVAQRFDSLTTDANATMVKVFERILNHTDDGAVRSYATVKGLRQALPAARAAGLLFLAVGTVNRLTVRSSAESPAAQQRLARLLDTEGFLAFTASADATSIVGRPQCSDAPAAPAVPEDLAEVVAAGTDPDDLDDATAAALQAYRSTKAAFVQLERRQLLTEARVSHAFDMFEQHCEFTAQLMTRQIEGNQSAIPGWMWILLFLCGGNEALYILTSPVLLLVIGAVAYLFFKQAIIEQWHRFEETAPPSVVLPLKTAGALVHAKGTQLLTAAGAMNPGAKPATAEERRKKTD